MILRLWNGWTSPADTEAYGRLLTEQIAPAIMARRVPGLGQMRVLRRDPRELDPASGTEFLTVMTFTDVAAVSAFTGGDPGISVVPPAARRLLTRFDQRSRHYLGGAVFESGGEDDVPPAHVAPR